MTVCGCDYVNLLFTDLITDFMTNYMAFLAANVLRDYGQIDIATTTAIIGS